MRSCLGQVTAVGAAGVFVVTPGVRGVVRGPFGSLHPVAVGDSVLVVTTGDGETLVAGPVSVEHPVPEVTGAADGNAALASLLTALEALGLIVDSST